MRVPLLTAALGFTLVAAAAPDARAQATASPIAGAYELVSVDGHAIPYAPVHPGRPADAPPGPEVVASTMMVRADGSFVMAMAYRMGTGEAQIFRAMPFSGTTRAEGDGWVATWQGAGETPLTLARDTLVMNNEGMLFRYVKRG
ncbi:MAG: hypothetical protein KGL38_15105 [Gemmatimonadota bacterium]|nr:hypothetical protein [Gemmatimonadota bacterium]MDE3215118.1 hypothetical protein [Gemmatimonadota bacterium]